VGLRFGARGPAVVALQRAIGVNPPSGWFGPRTWAAVAAAQRGHGLPVTGVVDEATARMLAAADRPATRLVTRPVPVAR
jgi:peptidoglycan hydrolase-like protein with peptidoglycan-binding domain